VSRIHPDGTGLVDFTVPGEASGITAGHDGNLWFSEPDLNKIGRITPDGVTITEFIIPTANSDSENIRPGPDRNLWFSERTGNKIARITPAGVITEFPIPTANSDPETVVAGSDGNLWFTETGANKIGRITPDGATITEFPIPTPSTHPDHLRTGPDGNIWFVEPNAGKIARILVQAPNTITEFPIPTPGNGVHDLVADTHGYLWVTERSVDKLARIQVPVSLTVSKAGTGAGTVTTTPARIDCGTTCAAQFLSATTVQLSETTFDVFGGWSGDCTASTATCTVAMTGNRTVTATFTKPPNHTLTVTKKGKGKVTSSPAGVSCGADCTESYPEATAVTLTKKPSKGWHFVKWTGACTGTKACALTMDGDKSVQATFAKNRPKARTSTSARPGRRPST
jgi:uncharacterized repeat protein (TIGR02543 family)